jgi:hypothetical protein
MVVVLALSAAGVYAAVADSSYGVSAPAEMDEAMMPGGGTVLMGGDAGYGYDGVDPTAPGSMDAGPMNGSRAASYEYGDPGYGYDSDGSAAERNSYYPRDR